MRETRQEKTHHRSRSLLEKDTPFHRRYSRSEFMMVGSFGAFFLLKEKGLIKSVPEHGYGPG